MSSHTVEFTTAAARELRKLDPPVRGRLLDAIAALGDDPHPPGSIKLAGTAGGYRIRVGDYRVLYEVDGSTVVVTVFRVAHRREVYDR